MKVLVIGGISYDDIIHLDEFFDSVPHTVFANDFYSTPGSTGLAKAIALKRLGFDVVLQGIIGNDIYGEYIRELMQKEGIEFYPTIDASGTERHVNIMNKSGNRISIFLNTTANNEDVDINMFEPIIKEVDFVCLNIKNYCRKFIPLLKKYNKPVWVDIHDYNGFETYHDDFIAAADFIFMSSDRMSNPDEYMKKWIKEGKELIVCTHGGKGSSYIDKSERRLDIDADELTIVDTNGAGDNFFAGFVYGYYHGFEPEIALQYARKAANSCVLSKKIVSDELNEELLLKNQ